MKQERTAGDAATALPTSMAPDDSVTPQRMLARLSHLEGVLRARKDALRSRLDELQQQLAQAGLDTPPRDHTG